jgi:hypothetical protein
VQVFLMGPVCVFPEDANLALVGEGKRARVSSESSA